MEILAYRKVSVGPAVRDPPILKACGQNAACRYVLFHLYYILFFKLNLDFHIQNSGAFTSIYISGFSWKVKLCRILDVSQPSPPNLPQSFQILLELWWHFVATSGSQRFDGRDEARSSDHMFSLFFLHCLCDSSFTDISFQTASIQILFSAPNWIKKFVAIAF